MAVVSGRTGFIIAVAFLIFLFEGCYEAESVDSKSDGDSGSDGDSDSDSDSDGDSDSDTDTDADSDNEVACLIDVQRIYDDIAYLAGAALGGRYVGSEGNELAMQMAEDAFFEAGLIPVGDNGTYRQAFNTYTSSFNIVGAIEGEDADIGDEVLVVGAHIDHVGSNPNMCDGTCLGADDNASGAAVIMELARSLADCAKPARTILFALWNGEEVGLLGSKYYVGNPIFPIESTIGAYSVDMVGAGTADGVVLYGGASPSNSRLADVMAGSAYDMGLEWPVYSTADLHNAGSDHIVFQGAGVPAVCEMSGSGGLSSHAFYHTPDDTIDHIDMGILDMSASLLAAGVKPIMEGTDGKYSTGAKSAIATLKPL